MEVGVFPGAAQDLDVPRDLHAGLNRQEEVGGDEVVGGLGYVVRSGAGGLTESLEDRGTLGRVAVGAVPRGVSHLVDLLVLYVATGEVGAPHHVVRLVLVVGGGELDPGAADELAAAPDHLGELVVLVVQLVGVFYDDLLGLVVELEAQPGHVEGGVGLALELVDAVAVLASHPVDSHVVPRVPCPDLGVDVAAVGLHLVLHLGLEYLGVQQFVQVARLGQGGLGLVGVLLSVDVVAPHYLLPLVLRELE